MNISSRCEYACRAMLELARLEQTGQPVSAQYIAERAEIPEKYLVHILLQLKRAGLVRSIRGPQGGYVLARPAEQISLYEVLSSIDGPLFSRLKQREDDKDMLSLVWQDIAEEMRCVLKKYSLANIVERVLYPPMYHI